MRYFDHNATTPLAPEAREAWLRAHDDAWLNPSAPYRGAARVHARLDAARERFAELLGADPDEIVFNSGATEGNNAVLRHFRDRLGDGRELWLSPVEHPSVLEPAQAFFGDRARFFDVDADGRIDPEAARAALDAGSPGAVSVMAANNETGVLQPWRELAEACRARGIRFHADASQWLGKMDADGLGACDFVVGCGHKFGGPRGVGLVKFPRDASEFGGQLGGEQEKRRRGGTENVPGVLAMLAALEAWNAADRRSEGRDAFEARATEALPGLEVVGSGAPRLWNTASIVPPRGENTRWIRALERRGFLVSSGSACATGKEGPSHVLAAMGLSAEAMRRVLRVSGGPGTTAEAWTELAGALAGSAAEMEESGGAGGTRTHVVSI